MRSTYVLEICYPKTLKYSILNLKENSLPNIKNRKNML